MTPDRMMRLTCVAATTDTVTAGVVGLHKPTIFVSRGQRPDELAGSG